MKKEKDYDTQSVEVIRKDLEKEVERVKAEIRAETRELVVLEAEVLEVEALEAESAAAQAIPRETRQNWVAEKKKDIEILRE